MRLRDGTGQLEEGDCHRISRVTGVKRGESRRRQLRPLAWYSDNWRPGLNEHVTCMSHVHTAGNSESGGTEGPDPT